MNEVLRGRLTEIGIDADSVDDAQEVFEQLFARFGDAVTLEDRLELEAHVCGVAAADLPPMQRRNAVEGFYGQRWDGFQIVGEERKDPIDVIDYDPAWPGRFAEWRDRLAGELGDGALSIEHVGSTAVPGLAAKPIVDIQVTVADLESEDAYVPAIERAGVALRSRDAEHRYFRPAPGRPREVQIHVCEQASAWERDHLEFRNYLRANDEARDAYATLKRALAEQFPDDRLAYTEAKTAFVAQTLEAARSQRGGD
jgi:GrpB-like predicted nucleotidyltransferase (UPF0157 family)